MLPMMKVLAWVNDLAVLWLVISSVAFAYQLVAYVAGYVPHHIMPLVKVISGTEQAVPVAYSWSAIGAIVSAVICASSALALVVIRWVRRR